MIGKIFMRGALIAISALLTFAGNALAQSRGSVSEEFNQTYPLASGGRISLKNINGGARVMAWDRDEVKVEAVKWAYNQERLADAKIIVDSTGNSVRIRTEYDRSTTSWTDDIERRYNNSPSVEYTLTVPRNVRIDAVELINGDLEIENLTGEVKASCINGRLAAKQLTGELRLSTINGLLEASLDALDESRPVSLSSVNGQVDLTIASDAEAEFRADTVHGSISNDIGLPVKRGKHVGEALSGLLGRGGARVKLKNVNGGIRIRRANDGRAPSSVINTLPDTGDRDRDDFDRDNEREAARAMREVEREVRGVEREARRAMREVEREMRRAMRESFRSLREFRRF
ncbi:MAG: DUF4097 family beta strand repeat-containing protein [Blastocatellia bacterium]|nr:DUF4097 family beta strand repeat-containing protein [Blastocatellia bacterium]